MYSLSKLNNIVAVIVCCLVHNHVTVASIDIDSDNPFEMILKAEGDIVLGGLIPVHRYYNFSIKLCHLLIGTDLLRVQAMIYFIEIINSNTKLLPNMKLG